jgi:hypothetical protein
VIRRILVLTLLLAGCGGHAAKHTATPSSGDPAAPGVTITLYDGWGIVEDRRRLDLPADGEVTFDGVPSLIDLRTTSVTATSADTRFTDQELVRGEPSTGEMITNSLGKQVTVVTGHGQVNGVLRTASNDGLVVESDAGIRLVPVDDVLSLSIDGSQWAGRPALRWHVKAPHAGKSLVTAIYRAMSLSWTASYAFVIDDEGDRTDVAAWITIANGSGAEFKNARVRLTTPSPQVSPLDAPAPAAQGTPMIIGQRTSNQQRVAINQNPRMGYAVVAMDPEPPPPPQQRQPVPQPAREKQESHSYWLTIPETIRAGTTTQIAYVPNAMAVPSRRVLVFDPIGAEGVWRGATIVTDPGYNKTSTAGVAEYVEIENTVEGGLGKDLPAGDARVFMRDAEGKLHPTGTTTLEHVGAGDRIRLKLGSSTDVVGTRKQTDFSLDSFDHRMVEEIEITLENKAKTPRDVVVLDRLARGDSWTVSWSSIAEDEMEKDDARTIRVPMKLAPGEKRTFSYRVVYTW